MTEHAETHELPRGLRNNNPGNLRDNPDQQWLGQTGADESGFAIFGTASYGIRALLHTLHTYYFVHNLRSVVDIIMRWAPPSENDTQAYVTSVATRMEVEPHVVLTWDQVSPALALAIIEHENGSIPYDQKTISDAIVLSEAH